MSLTSAREQVGGFSIFEKRFGEVGDNNIVTTTRPVSLQEIEFISFVIAGSFDFNGQHTFKVGCQGYDYPDRFMEAGDFTLTALEAGSTIVCVNPIPRGSAFQHAKQYRAAGDTILLSMGHLLYVAKGTVEVNGVSLPAPRAIFARTADITVKVTEDCIAVEMWK